MVSVNLIKFLDKYAGSLLCSFLSINKLLRYKKIHKYNKILIIQLWGIGETILTLPAIEVLRKQYKKSNIDILVTGRNKEVYYKNKYINDVKVLKLNPISIKLFMSLNFKKYDLAIDMEEYLNISSIIAFFTGKRRIGFSHGIRSNLYTDKVDYNDRQHVVYTFLDLLKPLGIKKRVEKLSQLNYSKNDKKNVDSLLKKYNIEKKNFLVGFGVGAAESAKSRMWPKEKFAKLADNLIKKYNAKIFLIGNDKEKNLIDELQNLIENTRTKSGTNSVGKNNSFNVSGEINVREMFYLISLCRLFIGNDSGPMHVAAAQNVKTIGLFGCNLPVRFAPFGKNNYSIYKKSHLARSVPLAFQKACINVHKGEVGECKHGMENACVKRIQVDDVTSLVDKVMKKRKR
ncbi:MAG: glycosyltransferase family 9 protein [Flavobacteriales bacterium]|jgi:heptosyltransferase-2|nr:glycosyltransferase family 9 protein [Flavobacteriales bacterium]